MSDNRRPAMPAASATPPADGGDALARLTWHYENRLAAALQRHAAGQPIAGFTSATVPWELLRAAGYFPVLLSPAPRPTPTGDVYMEDVFSARIRSIFDCVLTAEWQFLDLLVIPRTSEEEHKLYLYLREVERQGRANCVLSLLCFDLLHTRSHQSRKYGLDRTRQLATDLAGRTGRPIGKDEIAGAIEESNSARQALRQLLHLRQGEAPRLSGTQALAAIGAWYFMDRTEYSMLASEAASRLAENPPCAGPRILVKGAPLDHAGLHRAIESLGAMVVAEDDWWGSRAAGRDIELGDDLLACIFEKYYHDVPSPRVFPPEFADDWFQQMAKQVDGVVFYLPPEDDVMGWDYPRLRQWLDDRGIPSFMLRADARDLPPQEHERLQAFVGSLQSR